MPIESKTYELTGIVPAGDAIFKFDEVRLAAEGAAEIGYDQVPDGSGQKRLLSHGKSLYHGNDLTGASAAGRGRVAGDGGLVYGSNGELVLVTASPRWVGSGRTVFDNKGNPVKQYEPFFSDSYEYEDPGGNITEIRDAAQPEDGLCV